MASVEDVPSKYDVIINGEGYVLLDSLEPSLPFRTHRAIYDISPTFISRANTTGVYGDNQQDFWMTWNQEDWSLGEDQRFFRVNDADRIRRYFTGTNIDNRIPGQVTIRPPGQTITFSSTAYSAIAALTSAAQSCIHAAGTHDLFEVSPNGTFVSKGEHGLGGTPSTWSLAFDGKNTFLSATSGSVSAVRSWSGTAYSTFSASPCDSMAFINNALYGFRDSKGDFGKYDTTGLFTSIFTWQDAKGAAIIPAKQQVKIIPFGGKLAILRIGIGDEGTTEVWSFDGTSVSKIHQFEPNFLGSDIAQSFGVIYISGALQTASGGNTVSYPCVFYIANGTIGILWKSLSSTTAFSSFPIAEFDGGLSWPDYINGQYVYYNPITGGVSRIASITTSNVTNPVNVPGRTNFIHFGESTGADLFPNAASVATSASITSSLYDFDNSLDKIFRSIKVEFSSASDGDGGSVDIAYLTGDLVGTYTTLKTGATSGTEYSFTASGRNLATKITVNKGTSTAGPIFRRQYVRAAPILQSFRQGLYVLDLNDSRQLRDGSNHPKTGHQQMLDLITAAKVTTPFTIKDKSGTFTGFLDLQDPEGFDIYEIHPIGERQPPTDPGSYIARIKVREV